MMKKSQVLRIRDGLVLLGTAAAAHAAAAAQDSTHNLLPAARAVGFAREVLNATGTTVLLAVAGGLILLGSVLRRKLVSESAREQTIKLASSAPKEFARKPPEKTTSSDTVTPKSSVAEIQQPTAPVPIDAGVSDEQNLRLA